MLFSEKILKSLLQNYIRFAVNVSYSRINFVSFIIFVNFFSVIICMIDCNMSSTYRNEMFFEIN